MQPDQKKEFIERTNQYYDKFPTDVKKFYDFHGVQLFGCKFPMQLVENLYKKMSNALYDVGEYFEIIDNQDNSTYEVRAKQDIPANSQVFIIQHALTFRYPDLRRVLNQNPSLIGRIQEMLKYHKELKKLPSEIETEDKAIGAAGNFTEIEFDSMELTELSHLQFPKNTITLSLVSNDLSNEEELIKKIQYLDLKVLWVNSNPLEDSQGLAEYIENKTKIQIFNSKFTKHCTQWGIKYCQNRSLSEAFNQSQLQVTSLNLDERNVFEIDVDVLKKFCNLTSLSLKGHSLGREEHKKFLLHTLQNNKKLKFLDVDYDAQANLFEMFSQKLIPNQIAERLLVNGHSFRCKEPTVEDLQIDEIQKYIYKIAGCYRLASRDNLDQSSIWYINDEVGSSIQHSDVFNVKMVPFLFSEDNQMGQNMWAYSILWPVENIKEGEFLFRDYLHGIPENKQRSSRLAIWYDLPQQYFQKQFKQFDNKCKSLQKQSMSIIKKFYQENTENQRALIKKKSENKQLYPEKIKLVTDMELVQKYVDHKQIQFVKTLEEADAIWMSGSPDQQKWSLIIDKYYFNQFPFESCVIMKHNLADTIQSVFGNTPYLMRTYNLEKQLAEFVGEFKNRQKMGQDNLWILKPPNMARSMDMMITDNLSLIIKAMETGPKLAQKYIERPVLRKGRKIDLRYIILVSSIKPLTLHLYKHFWIRSSNNPYTLDRRQLSTYETQFTVMNYGNVTDFKQIKYKDFIEQFQKDYAPCNWSEVHEKIKKMLRNTFIAAGIKTPQMQSDKCRAIYGIDIMIDEKTMEPKLLEITFSPDCKRACEYYPTFYNEVIETLYLNVVGENMERII